MAEKAPMNLLFVEEGLPIPTVPHAKRITLEPIRDTELISSLALSQITLELIEERAWTILDEMGGIQVNHKSISDHFTTDLNYLDIFRFDFYIYFFRNTLTLAALLQLAFTEHPRAALHIRVQSHWMLKLIEEAAKFHKRTIINHPPTITHRALRFMQLMRDRDTIKLNQYAPKFVRQVYRESHHRSIIRSTPKPPVRGVAGLIYVSNQLEAIAPVLNALPAGDHPYLAIYDDPLGTVSSAVALRHPVSAWPIVQLNRFSRRQLSHGRAAQLRYLKGLRIQMCNAIQASTIEYESQKLGPALANIFSQWLYDRGRLAEILRMADTMEQFFMHGNPKMSLNAVEYTPLGRLWIRLGRQHQVPSLHIPHSLILGQTEHRSLESDAVALQGQMSKDCLLESGVDEQHLHIVGSPKHDAIFSRSFNDEATKEQLGFSRQTRLITLATNPIADALNAELLKSVIRVCQEHPTVSLAIKLHPLERGALHRKLLDEAGFQRATIVKDFDLYNLLHASEIVVVYYSTVALDAMLLDKKVITANFSAGEDRYPYASSGAAAGAKSAEELSRILAEWLEKQDLDPHAAQRRAFIARYFYRTDGHASKRAAELVDTLSR